MNRNQSLEMWQRIADGELTSGEQWAPEDPWDWIRGVAAKMITADAIKNPNLRSAAIVSAAGLKGQKDKYEKLRELVEVLSVFTPIDDHGNEIYETQGKLITRIMESARRDGLLQGNYLHDDKKAKDLIRDIKHQRI